MRYCKLGGGLKRANIIPPKIMFDCVTRGNLVLMFEIDHIQRQREKGLDL